LDHSGGDLRRFRGDEGADAARPGQAHRLGHRLVGRATGVGGDDGELGPAQVRKALARPERQSHVGEVGVDDIGGELRTALRVCANRAGRAGQRGDQPEADLADRRAFRRVIGTAREADPGHDQHNRRHDGGA
jgi:hypothetical protein